MSWPPAIKTFTVTFGPGTTLALGTALGMKVDFTPSTSAVWAATGTPLIALVESAAADEGMEGTATLPNPAQDGFIDGNGNAIRDWTYRAAVSYLKDGRVVATASKVFTVTADATTVDLDTLIPVTSSAGVVIAIPDQWGTLVTQAQQAATDAAASVEGFAGVADEVNTGRLSEEGLSATIVTSVATGVATVSDQALFRKTGPITRPKQTILATFAAGHGWTQSGFASSNLNDTSESVLSTQVISGTTDETTSGRRFEKTGLTAFDPTKKVFVVWMKISEVAKLSAAYLYLSSDGGWTNTSNYRLHLPSRSVMRDGEWFPMTVTAADMGPSGTGGGTAVTAMRLIVQSIGGAGNAVTVKFGGITMHDLHPAYPKGVCVFTFDDGFANNILIAAPALTALGFRGSVFPIIDQMGQPGRLTLDQLHQLVDIHQWDVGDHCTTQALHNAGLASLTVEELETEFRAIKAWALANGFSGEYFATPLGWPSISDNELAVTPVYFPYQRITGKGYRDTLPPSDMNRVRGITLGSGFTLATVEAEVDKAYANGEMITFLVHELASTATNSTTWAIADFLALAAYVAAKGDMPVHTVTEVVRNLQLVA